MSDPERIPPADLLHEQHGRLSLARTLIVDHARKLLDAKTPADEADLKDVLRALLMAEENEKAKFRAELARLDPA